MEAICVLMVFVASLFKNADAAPVFMQPTKGPIFASVGKSVKFSFRFTGSFNQIEFGPSSGVRITVIAIRVTKGTPLTILTLPKYEGRLSWAGNVKSSPVEAVFNLSNVSQADSGKYGCEVTESGSVFAETELTITDVNIVEHPKSAICPTLGGEVNFTCNATGTPHPNVTWVKSGKEIGESSLVKIMRDGRGYSKLTIKNCGRDDALAKYRCKASNPPDLEVISKNATLFFHFTANDAAVDEYSSPSMVTVGMETTLRCAFRSYPPPSIIWTLPNGSSIQTYLPFLVIEPMSSEQFGNYTCSADGFTLRTITVAGKATGNDKIIRLRGSLVPVDVDVGPNYKVAVTRQGSPDSFYAIISKETKKMMLNWASEVSNIEDKEKEVVYLLDVRALDTSIDVTKRYNITLVSKATLFQAGFLAFVVPLSFVLLSAGFQ